MTQVSVRKVIETYKIEIKRHRLANGLCVLVIEDHSAPLASVQMWYKVGSRNEVTGKTGLAHLLEHLMFNGTKRFPPNYYSELVSMFGGYENAYTSKDVTTYWAVIPSSKVETLLELEADRMVNCTFSNFEEEKRVVMEERRLQYENNPYGMFWEYLEALAFTAHPYRRPVIGWMSDLEKMELDDVLEFYRTFYRPDNALLAVSGDVESEQVFSWAEQHFGDIEAGETPVPEVRTVEPPQVGEKRMKIRRWNGLRIWGVAFHIPKFSAEDYPEVAIMASLIGAGKSSRLHKALVDEGLATEIAIQLDRTLDPGLLSIEATPKKGVSFDKIEEVVFKELDRLKDEPVSDREFTKIMNSIVSGLIFSQESIVGKGMTIASFEVLDGQDAFNRWLQRLLEVTPERIRKAAQKYLVETNRTVVMLEPSE